MIKLDEKSLLAIELLARTGGGFDPARVTTSALRPLLRRRQNDVFDLIKLWKAALGANAEANLDPLTAPKTAGDQGAPIAVPSRDGVNNPGPSVRGAVDLKVASRKLVTPPSTNGRSSDLIFNAKPAPTKHLSASIQAQEKAAGGPEFASSVPTHQSDGTRKLAMMLGCLWSQSLPVARVPAHAQIRDSLETVTAGAVEICPSAQVVEVAPDTRRKRFKDSKPGATAGRPTAPVKLREAARRARSKKLTAPVSNGEPCPARPLAAFEHQPPYMLKAEARRQKLQTFSSFAIEYLQLVGRPASAVEIYDAATVKKLNLGFVRSSAIAMLIDADRPELCRLDNGLFWLSGLAVPTAIPPDGFHSRLLKIQPGPTSRNDTVTKPASLRNQEVRAGKLAAFAAFAVMYLTEINRPAGATEIFDAAKVAGKAPFARQSARDVLSEAADPRLKKLPDGTFWLADRADVPPERSTRYFPRTRKEGYEILGKELVAILTACGCAMTAVELIVRLSPEAREILPNHHASFAFNMAARHFPRIIRVGYGLWFLEETPETRPRHLSLEDEFAIAAIEIARLRGPSTAAEIRSNLPPHLRRLFPEIPTALGTAAESFTQLQFDGEKWFVPAKAVILVQAVRQ